MADEEVKTLEDLGELTGQGSSEDTPAPAAAPVYEQVLDEHGRAYATGKRKDAVARVWIKPGAGRIEINGKEHAEYFARPVLQMILKQPIAAADRVDQYDIKATVRGGGLSGQAGGGTPRHLQGAHAL